MERAIDIRAAKKRQQRKLALLRLERRVKSPVRASLDAPDPMTRKKPRVRKTLLKMAFYLLVALVIHIIPLVVFFSMGKESSRTVAEPRQSQVTMRVVQTKPPPSAPNVMDESSAPMVETSEPEPEPVPPESKRKPKKARRPVETETMPADWVDMAEKPEVQNTNPRRRVVGLSFESTVKGSGPSFAVGNTRMGETKDTADDPAGIGKLGPATRKSQAEKAGSGANRAASFIPSKGVDFKKPKRLRTIKLEYPSTMKARGIEGNVVVMIQIDQRGKVQGVRILKSSGYEELDTAAERAAAKESFAPARKNGEPVDYNLKYTYRFRIRTS